MVRLFTNTAIMGPPTYVGPGDIVAADGWWGLRAYSNAAIGTNAVRLRENGGNTEQDFATVAGGGLPLGAITTFKGANSLFTVKLYDQTGGGHDMVQATAANQPLFTLSAIGTLPALDNTAAATIVLTSSSFSAQAQPISFSLVFNRTNGGVDSLLVDTSNDGIQIDRQFLSGANNVNLFASANFSAAANDSTWHAVQMLANGASSALYVDGSNTAGNAGTGSFAAGGLSFMGQAGPNLSIVGYAGELGLYFSDISASFPTLNTNQHTYWGF